MVMPNFRGVQEYKNGVPSVCVDFGKNETHLIEA